MDDSGNVLEVFTWGPNGLISERLMLGTPSSRWFHYGPQGETRYLTNSAGAIVDSYRYTAYGVPLATTGTDYSPHRFGGKYGYYSEGNAGLILATWRWYSPNLMRWLSRDGLF